MSLPLKDVRLFSGLDPEQLKKLEQHFVKASFKAREHLSGETDPDKGFFLIREGQARLMARNELQQPRAIETLGPGDFFGELSLVTDEPTPFWVEASTPVDALYLAPSDFRDFLTDHPQAVFDIFDVLGKRLLRLEHAIRRKVSRDVNELHEEKLTQGERAADRFASLVGSWPFIIAQTVILCLWVFLNVVGWMRAWDPYPFILLNLALSFQAAYAGPIIMMSQNRASNKDRTAAVVDHQVNLKSELEIALLLRKVEAIERVLYRRREERGS